MEQIPLQASLNYQQLLEQAHDYVSDYYKSSDTSSLVYHNIQHTKDVSDAASKIANHYQLSDHDFFIVMVSVWFHDIGYMIDVTNHEQESARIAAGFLKKNNIDNDDTRLVENCIMATKMPQSPVTLPEQIICDADLFHLGTKDFFKKDKLLHQEVNILHHADLNKTEWRQKSVKFLESHTYHTDYVKLLLNDGKAQNLQELKDKLKKKEDELKEEAMEQKAEMVQVETPKAESKKKNKDKEKPEKGIETMFRISSSNHQRLSDMADNKAHIMITVNSIILSAIISLLLRRLSEYEYLVIPTFILLSVSLLAMTFSILSTRPSLPTGIFTRNDVDEKKVNLLFFGNFYKMSLEDYNYGMQKMMEDKDFLYGSLIRDVYNTGIVLGKKYRLLRAAYNIFMFGLIISVIAFIIASAFFTGKPVLGK